ncbi:MAG: hypothetical protein ABI402_16215 [Ferruginibacter sp.]
MKQKKSITWLILSFCFFLSSCFVPNGYFEADAPSKCVYFNIDKFQVERQCRESKQEEITSLSVTILFDTLRLIKGEYVNGYIAFKKNDGIDFPFSLDTIIKDRSTNFKISLETNIQHTEYALHPDKNKLQTGLIPFTYYYHR